MSSSSSVEAKLKELGLVLPPAPPAKANYVPVVQVDNLLYLSGHLPTNADGSLHTGQLRDNETDVQKGYAAAQAVALNLLATIHQHVQGDWSQVQSIVKLFGIVNSADTFTNQHLVLNGASDLMVQVVGGTHARSAIGTNTLPLGITVEIEAIVQLKT